MQALRQRIADIRSSSQDALSASAEAPSNRGKRRSRSKSSASVAGHRLFVPLIALWGAAVGALSVLVLPMSSILRGAMNVGLAGLGTGAAYVFAALAAVILGAVAAFGATAFKRRVARSSATDPLAGFAMRKVTPIDPAAELGSDSLDAPLETEPFTAPVFDGDDDGLTDDDLLVLGEDQICEAAEETAGAAARGPTLGELSERGYDADPADLQSAAEEGSEPALRFTRRDYQTAIAKTCEAISDTASDESAESKPRALDLAEFAETPGRNGVWDEDASDVAAPDASVDEPEAEAEPAPDANIPATLLAARIAPSAPTALEKLRQAPVQELSLVHMVERFAAALHDHQDEERKRPGSTQSPRSDAALAEALRALTLFTGDGFDADPQFSGKNADALRDTTRELRDALAKLQDLRGAA